MDNELTKYVAGDSPLLLPHSRDDYNALQCELIATRRANDALIMENHASNQNDHTEEQHGTASKE